MKRYLSECPVCGNRIQEEPVVCLQCGNEEMEDIRFIQESDAEFHQKRLKAKRLVWAGITAKQEQLVEELTREKKRRQALHYGFVGNLPEPEMPGPLILCAEVGHKRCKMCLMQLSDQRPEWLSKTSVLSAEDFLGERGFNFFVSTMQQFAEGLPVNGLALSLVGPIDYDGDSAASSFGGWPPEGWPQAVKETLAREFGMDKVIVLNDAVAFSLGCSCSSVSEFMESIEYPSLCLTFGDGVGCSLLRGDREEVLVRPVELYARRRWVSDFEGDCYELAGNPFFKYVRQDTDWNLQDIRREFSRRVAYIIDFVERHLDFSSVILGGGRSHFVDLNEVSSTVKNSRLSIHLAPNLELPLLGVGEAWVKRFMRGKMENQFIASRLDINS